MLKLMHKRKGKAIKAMLFVLIAILFFGFLNVIVQPDFLAANYNSTNGFYEQPQNTIETLFLGSSHVRNAVSPMELYEEYGICAYDLSTDGQPISASYYWLEETYRFHSETLDTVLLDVSLLREAPYKINCQKALEPMRFSMIKLRAVESYSENFLDFLWNMAPLLSYHERWKELSSIEVLRDDWNPEVYLRGYLFHTSCYLDGVKDYSELYSPFRVVDELAGNTIFDETELEYLDKIVSFCENHDINLILIKIPTGWSASDHNATQKLADFYGIDFLDFNADPYYSEIGLNMAVDVRNQDNTSNLHLNYYGTKKVTDYLGRYLIEECGNNDIRGEESYAFMEEELNDYHRYIVSGTTKQFTDPCDYIEYALEQGDYTIFLSVKDDAAGSLTDLQRDYFASVGLTQLSTLSYGDSYLAVIEDGEIVTELSQKNAGDGQTDEALLFEGKLSADGTSYSISCGGGYNLGNESSIVIGGAECSTASRGLNIVLYDNTREQVMDKVNFDTCAASERNIQNKEQRLSTLLADGVTYAELSGTDRILYQYNRSCELKNTVALMQQEVREDGLFDYLAAFWDDEELEIYLTVQGDAAGAMTEEARTAFVALGLIELAQIEERDAYLAVIVGGEVMQEERGDAADLLEICTNQYLLRSGITESGQVSSVVIDGQEYSQSENGINIVIYDQITESVVNAISFDTGTTKPDIVKK